ncbi:hypothetical protein KXD40_005352 [Peronospora effusa]|uniref:Uncharacterized protein n=2 Tax=Peronospora TaxID=70742 RepID=A0A3M6VWG0_9STRA|nr:hypothetical protein DD238_001709 [Peronospora effusa]CAH0493031.1 unnamed protein product [Peronospora farinosa]RQM16735.1 hypothetical protein DD237_000560 [Peronospora effusa]UIZ22336.1 hypothetical protein KXD40_005352 [Peronospora effusa]CAI5703556.1 unnamed protein product [Peronospora effusa]
MLANTSRRLPKAAARCISSSTPTRVLQQTSAASSCSKTNTPQVTPAEKVWCDIYGVDYEKQIQETLHESPAAAEAAPKPVNYPTAAPTSSVQAQSKADIWNVVFGDREST